jgi:hypothetical protein
MYLLGWALPFPCRAALCQVFRIRDVKCRGFVSGMVVRLSRPFWHTRGMENPFGQAASAPMSARPRYVSLLGQRPTAAIPFVSIGEPGYRARGQAARVQCVFT